MSSKRKEITVADLHEQTCVPGPHPALYCRRCGATYSANRADYFMFPKDHVFLCCGRPMRLVVKRVVFTEVSDV